MLKTLKQEAKITEAVLRVSPSILRIYCEGRVDGSVLARCSCIRHLGGRA